MTAAASNHTTETAPDPGAVSAVYGEGFAAGLAQARAENLAAIRDVLVELRDEAEEGSATPRQIETVRRVLRALGEDA